ncbi:MAG: FecR domain-containing protein, partial [Muribaculaceae bacterium]|nr:FecR domain-containing protein [Muribaculaceae bacterium]
MNKELIEKYRNNNLSEKELREFINEARNVSPDEFASALAEDMESFQPDLKTDSDAAGASVLAALKNTLFSKNRQSLPIYKIASVAAAVLIPLLIFGNIYFYNEMRNTPDIATSITTDVNRLTSVELPDGSNVAINTNSHLSYSSADFKNDCRTIDFEGEGYFTIAKSEKRSFTIKAREMEVKVHGTTFNLQAYKDAPSATLCLVEGEVTMTSRKSGNSVDLSPNEMATLDYATGTIAVKPMEPNENSLAWKAGRLKFHNARMSEVIRQIESNYSCRVIT